MYKEELCCKYCLEEGTKDNPIIYPCNCSDGVHLNCLKVWLTYSKHKENKQNMCEICQQHYVINENIVLTIPHPPLSPPENIFEPRTQNVYSIANNVYQTQTTNYIVQRRIIHRKPRLCENCDIKEQMFYSGSIIFGISTWIVISVNNQSAISIVLTGMTCFCIFMAALSTKVRLTRIYRENRYNLRRIQIAPRIT
jgi:hypothetical protein